MSDHVCFYFSHLPVPYVYSYWHLCLSTQVKIIADKENDPNESGIGELCVRSPSLFKEYWKKHEVIQLIIFANNIFFH